LVAVEGSVISENHATYSAPESLEPTVFVVEDESALLSVLLRTLQRAGMKAAGFASAEDFLAAFRPEQPGCLLLDVSLPGMSGLQLQEALRQRNARLPIIFVTGSADVSVATAGMKAGAVDLIEKPFQDEWLFGRVREALELDRQRRAEHASWLDIDLRIAALTTREREVLDHIVAGHANKMIALMLDTSPRTVEVHRARIMRKMKVDNLPELVRVSLLWRSGSGFFGR
jgi:two-component system, LuxR family, response regulator FixJ